MTTPPTVAALLRYGEQALNAAALVAAISNSTSSSVKGLEALSARQDQQLSDLLHDLAFKGRKYFELAASLLPPFVKERFDRGNVAGYREREDDQHGDVAAALDGLDSYSLRFLFGRIIHSENLEVHRSDVPLIESRYSIPAGVAWGFRVRSDFDRAGEGHFVFIEFLLKEVVAADEVIEPLVRRLLAQST
jgi:hypothetical protein